MAQPAISKLMVLYPKYIAFFWNGDRKYCAISEFWRYIWSVLRFTTGETEIREKCAIPELWRVIPNCVLLKRRQSFPYIENIAVNPNFLGPAFFRYYATFLTFCFYSKRLYFSWKPKVLRAYRTPLGFRHRLTGGIFENKSEFFPQFFVFWEVFGWVRWRFLLFPVGENVVFESYA